MYRLYNKIILLAGLVFILASCTKDLNTVPLDPKSITSATVFDNPAAYKEALAKIYAGLALSGQQGPAGAADISGIDEGFGEYLRGLWYLEELPTDEAVISWNDQTIKDFHNQSWGSSDVFISAFYYRVFYQIGLCNEFLRQTTDAKLNERGVDADLKAKIKHYRAEARFLRALSYYHALDEFGNVPFVTEKDPVGAFFPKQISRADLFNYIESELKAIEPDLIDARQNEYGRADKAADWTLLAKLYLNAKVFTGQERNTDCITYCKKVIDAGYSLKPEYKDLFLADNNVNNNEVIFSVNFDGIHTQTWGGTTFIIHAAVGGSMTPADYGIDGGWAGTRTTSAFVNKFPDVTGTTDKRAMFYTDGQKLEINDVGKFTDGYAITKFKNITSTGTPGSDLTFPDTDFPMFRLADVYLMYAEAVVRGGAGGDMATAVNLVNKLRERAYGNNSGDITANDLTLDFILDERARELYWEAQRRTDLIRFGKFTGGDYLWPWKGGVKEGTATDSHYDLYPIPASDITSNPNLVQNPGY
ncbi:MAG TPA: RagB/SusD family nutrient uptake outer membrane protein [Bacteroidetes bacterium]|nr:RagB/SusD family nutrient uptake outer membrane protein [Bacteroidota bacterium]